MLKTLIPVTAFVVLVATVGKATYLIVPSAKKHTATNTLLYLMLKTLIPVSAFLIINNL